MKIARMIRDLWVAFGIALVGLVLLEVGYRGQRWLRKQLQTPERRPAGVVHPYSQQAWWKVFQPAELKRDSAGFAYDSYRGIRLRPFASALVNVDSMGRRVTPQSSPTEPVQSVLIFGGSAVFGVTARDSATIPALLAARLREHGLGSADVVNRGVPAFNLTQEAISLLLDLALDRRPAVVVFLDGYNDAAQGLLAGAAGRNPYEQSTQSRIDLARRGFTAELLGLGRHAQLVKRIRNERTWRDPVPLDGDVKICGAVGGYYRRMAGAVEAVARERGVALWFVQQPTLATTNKVQTGWERSRRQAPAVRACLGSIDSAMSDRGGSGYLSLAHLFDRDTATVFVDEYAHLTEEGNQRVAQCLAALIAPSLSSGKPDAQSRSTPDGCRP